MAGNLALQPYVPPYEDGSGLYSSNILGPDGQPARLTRDQRDEALMGSYDSIFAKSYQFAGFTPDALISSKGFQVIDDYCHQQSAVGTPVGIIRKACLSKGVTVKPFSRTKAELPPPDAQHLRDHLQYDLDNIIDDVGNHQDPRHVINELLYAVHMGFHITEMNWDTRRTGPYKGKQFVSEFASKPCKQIGFRLDKRTMRPIAITSYTPETGYQITPGIPVEKVLRYTYDAQDNLPFGWGGGRRAYKHIWSIDNLYRFWNIFCEVFATPNVIVKAPPGRAMSLASAALAAMRQGSTVALPDNCEAEILQVAQNGKTFFNEAISHHKDQIAYNYLYSTLTSSEGSDHGTQSLGTVHQDTTDYPICFARQDVEFVMNSQYVRRWVIYNYGEDALSIAPRISLGDWDSVDFYNMTRGFNNLVTMGNMHPSNPDIRARLNLSPVTAEEQAQLDSDKEEKAQMQKMQLLSKSAPGGKGPGRKPASKPAPNAVRN